MSLKFLLAQAVEYRLELSIEMIEQYNVICVFFLLCVNTVF